MPPSTGANEMPQTQKRFEEQQTACRRGVGGPVLAGASFIGEGAFDRSGWGASLYVYTHPSEKLNALQTFRDLEYAISLIWSEHRCLLPATHHPLILRLRLRQMLFDRRGSMGLVELLRAPRSSSFRPRHFR